MYWRVIKQNELFIGSPRHHKTNVIIAAQSSMGIITTLDKNRTISWWFLLWSARHRLLQDAFRSRDQEPIA